MIQYKEIETKPELNNVVVKSNNLPEPPKKIKKTKPNILIIEEEDTEDTKNDKQLIIDKFMTNVKGKPILIKNIKHCGSEGHWLETQFGISSNNKNEPDLLGYEMKKNSSKITFGDFSASEYLFSKKKEIIENMNNWKKGKNNITREDYIKYFGTPNPLKNNRYSWSSCVPTYGIWNYCGQMLKFNDSLTFVYIIHLKMIHEKIKFLIQNLFKII